MSHELMLHRADRHLLYPPGGLAELKKRDPMRVAEERELAARNRRGIMRGADGPAGATIVGLNIQLNTPALIEEWIKQRRKRYPTPAVVAQKEAQRRIRGAKDAASSQPAAPDTHPDTSSDMASSDSDMDPERDAVSSKIPVPERRETVEATHSAQKRTAPQEPVRRVAPRAAPRNPFDPPDLLRALLGHEIEQHVHALAQVLQFLLDNDMLAHVEREIGQAEAQQARRTKIVPLAPSAPPGRSEKETHPFVRPSSPALRALDSLHYPPEPDPLIYMDPLRRLDPKPLRRFELEAIAKDATLREIVQPASPLHPYGEKNEALFCALQTWDALPTDQHRQSALELILGVGKQSPVFAHEAYTPAAQRPLSAPHARRHIGETELFRLGLRVGANEVRLIQHLAECVSGAIKSTEYCLAIPK
ncbi:hypothetical protein MVES1_003612 [Malassezia vespertilionis]|uniref:uncharacterized protein n=1 Tax=Malassezia vespertilionis TaxID=2020962 RepID=UPI0024B13028|nr:uncharacterized protein MVES1_003612 [Malassezia vespertilionis]WFD08240.1 hypothetical protein MVES1_003612 [Malassezia vespertilionis]